MKDEHMDKVGLCNGALGTVIDFVYAKDQAPPTLPICVIVQFDEDCSGPSASERFPRLFPFPQLHSDSIIYLTQLLKTVYHSMDSKPQNI